MNGTFSDNTSPKKPYTKSGQFPDKHSGGKAIKALHSAYTSSGHFPDGSTKKGPKDAPYHHSPGMKNKQSDGPITSTSHPKNGSEVPTRGISKVRRPKKRANYSSSVMKMAKEAISRSSTQSGTRSQNMN